jgi:hypothetical protein
VRLSPAGRNAGQHLIGIETGIEGEVGGDGRLSVRPKQQLGLGHKDRVAQDAGPARRTEAVC